MQIREGSYDLKCSFDEKKQTNKKKQQISVIPLYEKVHQKAEAKIFPIRAQSLLAQLKNITNTK